MAETWLVPWAGRRAGQPRRRLAIPARLTWKDAAGTVRVASVVAHDVDANDVIVECLAGAPIPRYRLVHLLIEGSSPDPETVPAQWRTERVLAAVWHVAPSRPATGIPAGYTLRILADPATSAARPAPDEPMAVAS